MNPLPLNIYENIDAVSDLKEETKGGEFYTIDHVEVGNGVRVFCVGHELPQHGLPLAEAIVAINAVKRVVLEFLKMAPLLAFRSFPKNVKSFSSISWHIIKPYILKWEFMSPAPRHLRLVILMFLCEIGIKELQAQCVAAILSHIFEYDNAYRYRFQDLAGEMRLPLTPKEVRRLIDINKARDSGLVGRKIAWAKFPLSFLLYIPKYRRALNAVLGRVGTDKFKFDDADKYWVGKRYDYNYMGNPQRTAP